MAKAKKIDNAFFDEKKANIEASDAVQYEEEKRQEKIKPELAAEPGTDGKVTMKKDGVGRRYHVSRIKEMEAQGWELVG